MDMLHFKVTFAEDLRNSEYKERAVDAKLAEMKAEIMKALEPKASEEPFDGAITPSMLVYSAGARCKCGAGLAYVKDREKREALTLPQAWLCSSVMLKMHEPQFITKLIKGGGLFGGGVFEDNDGVAHDQSFPWTTYEIKSENQPSANGRTTRPVEGAGVSE